MEDIIPIIKPVASRLLARISRYLTKAGVNAYLTGGYVRDTLLGRDTGDIDITVEADALETASGAAAALGGKYVPLDEQNRVGRVILSNTKWQIDFTTFQGEIRQDLARRDFTINAVALELGKTFSIENLLDPFHGREDLRRGIIRAVSDNVFRDDAVRLLRAVRLAAELGFSIEAGTEALISRQRQLIKDAPGERIREELLRLLALPGTGPRLTYLDKLGLLTALIPELSPTRGIDQPRMHIWDVFEHSLQTVTAVEYLLREGTWEHGVRETLDKVYWSTRLREHFDKAIGHGSTRRSLLKLAALLHDIAKPQTKTIADDGRAHFLGHPQEGSAAAAVIMERLRFSNRETQYVELLIKYHLRPTQMSQEGTPTRRAIYRYFRDTGEAGIDILFLSLADHLAARGPALDSAQWQEHTQMTDDVINKHFREESLCHPLRFLDGHDIMKMFRLEPGRRVGELLEALKEAQAAGEVNDKQKAIKYVTQLLAEADNPEK